MYDITDLFKYLKIDKKHIVRTDSEISEEFDCQPSEIIDLIQKYKKELEFLLENNQNNILHSLETQTSKYSHNNFLYVLLDEKSKKGYSSNIKERKAKLKTDIKSTLDGLSPENEDFDIENSIITGFIIKQFLEILDIYSISELTNNYDTISEELSNGNYIYRKPYNEFIKEYNLDGLALKEYSQNSYYINAFSSFKEELPTILSLYKQEIIELIKDDLVLNKIFVIDDEIRHDLDFDEEIDIEKVINSFFEPSNDLNEFEIKAKFYIILKISNLIKSYGIDELKNNQQTISKEIIYMLKYNNCLYYGNPMEKDKIFEIGEKYGKDAIPYFKCLSLLKTRIKSLIEFSENPVEIKELKGLFSTVDNPEIDYETLKSVYSQYEKINRQMILSRIISNPPDIIDTPDKNSLLLLHFISEHTQKTDFLMDNHYNKYVDETIKSLIKKQFGDKLSEEEYQKEYNVLYNQYLASLDNPCDFSLRLPLPTKAGFNIITKPSTTLSTSLSVVGNISPHLDRKIALGFSAEDIPLDAILAIDEGYSKQVDRWQFEKDSVPLSEVYFCNLYNITQETLLDWTKIKPSFIFVRKDEENIPQDILDSAQKLHELSGLPVKIYDEYKIKQKTTIPLQTQSKHEPISGAFSIDDLQFFARIATSEDELNYIQELLKDYNQTINYSTTPSNSTQETSFKGDEK